MSSLAAITGLYMFSRKMVLPRRAKIAISLLTAMAYSQVSCQSSKKHTSATFCPPSNSTFLTELCLFVPPPGRPWHQHPVAICPHSSGSNSPVRLCGSSLAGHLGSGRASQNAKIKLLLLLLNGLNKPTTAMHLSY